MNYSDTLFVAAVLFVMSVFFFMAKKWTIPSVILYMVCGGCPFMESFFRKCIFIFLLLWSCLFYCLNLDDFLSHIYTWWLLHSVYWDPSYLEANNLHLLSSITKLNKLWMFIKHLFGGFHCIHHFWKQAH